MARLDDELRGEQEMRKRYAPRGPHDNTRFTVAMVAGMFALAVLCIVALGVIGSYLEFRANTAIDRYIQPVPECKP